MRTSDTSGNDTREECSENELSRRWGWPMWFLLVGQRTQEEGGENTRVSVGGRGRGGRLSPAAPCGAPGGGLTFGLKHHCNEVSMRIKQSSDTTASGF